MREKALHLTREEVPHALTVEVDEIEERRLRAVIYVETESQKGILVGKKGVDGARDRRRARDPRSRRSSAARSSSSCR